MVEITHSTSSEVYFISRLFTLHDEVKPLYEKYFAISLSGDPSRGEDWDFVLENINKKKQSCDPKGCAYGQVVAQCM